MELSSDLGMGVSGLSARRPPCNLKEGPELQLSFAELSLFLACLPAGFSCTYANPLRAECYRHCLAWHWALRHRHTWVSAWPSSTRLEGCRGFCAHTWAEAGKHPRTTRLGHISDEAGNAGWARFRELWIRHTPRIPSLHWKDVKIKPLHT